MFIGFAANTILGGTLFNVRRGRRPIGHWYTQDGEPMHWVPNKSKPGETRPTTIRDAKKLNLRPSVTEILKVPAKPGLEKWKQEQLLMAALTLPRIEDETLDEFMARAKADSEEQVSEAVEKGNAIHADLEKYFSGFVVHDHGIEVGAVVDLLDDLCGPQDWVSEQTFAAPDFGGMVDLHSTAGDGIIVDFKTKDGDLSGRLNWAEQEMQMAAYAVGLGLHNARLINIYVSRTHPGKVGFYEWPRISESVAWDKFNLLLRYWQLDKGYIPQEK